MFSPECAHSRYVRRACVLGQLVRGIRLRQTAPRQPSHTRAEELRCAWQLWFRHAPCDGAAALVVRLSVSARECRRNVPHARYNVHAPTQRTFRTAAMGCGLGWGGLAWRGLGSVQELLSAEVPWDMVDSDAELKAVFRTLSLDR